MKKKANLKFVMGIDPGKNGAITLLGEGDNISMHKMPQTATDLLDYLKKFSDVNLVCYMEKLHGRPGMGGTTMFALGQNFGWLEMALAAAGIVTHYISPQKWQKHYSLGTRKESGSDTVWKNKLKAEAQRLFPRKNIFLWGADAALIAYYGRFIENGSR